MRRIPVCLSLTLLLSGCVSPAWDDHDYALKAAASAEAAASGVEMARLAVRDGDRLMSPYVKTLLTEVSEDLSGIAGQFGGVQPPSRASDEVREELLELLSQAEDDVDGLLIELRRAGIARPAQAAARLEEIAGRLRATGERLR
ncbi:hypothetical protein [Planobispora takensis]|uniref:Lipoprotein n=1 Tax=Planobispora takensis TaxID=1367882 RepID=A0A8J3T619_9ACTN|nr:hypothetical protein [Planobispora takensis]GII06087.1 hypothetical protein Pta02_80950 [Planobispora takensis]